MCMTVRTNKKLKFPDDLKLSKDKNMMIFDIGATCESTPHEADIKLRKNWKAGDSATNASGVDMAENMLEMCM